MTLTEICSHKVMKIITGRETYDSCRTCINGTIKRICDHYKPVRVGDLYLQFSACRIEEVLKQMGVRR